jgi:hypothetical protein
MVTHHMGEFFPSVGFIVTTLTGTNRAVVRFDNQRGTAEQWIKEGKAATHWTRLSCHPFRANEVRLLLGVIACNLGNLLRRLVLPLALQRRSLTSLQQRLFKAGGRLIGHARYFLLQLAESHWPKANSSPLDYASVVGAVYRLFRTVGQGPAINNSTSGTQENEAMEKTTPFMKKFLAVLVPLLLMSAVAGCAGPAVPTPNMYGYLGNPNLPAPSTFTGYSTGIFTGTPAATSASFGAK